MIWSCFLHIYQPPWQKKEILAKIVEESYLPVLEILERNKGAKITLNINASLTELLIENNFFQIIEKIKKLLKRGQIEITGSAAYHPILPLIPTSEIIRQIELNEKINKKYFGRIWQPKGFFLPEMAYDKKTAEIIKSFGYQWLILDEIAYQGVTGRVSFDKKYQLKDLGLKIIFRNRGLSDTFFTGWLDSEEKFKQAVENDYRDYNFLITAFDGENLGHHRPGMESVFEKIINQIKTKTISELLIGYQREEIIDPLASSWSSKEEELNRQIPFLLWQNPNNEIHQLQWQLTNFTLATINKSKKDSNYKQARFFLDKTLNSCQYWWASASPWWSREIIQAEAKQMTLALKMLAKPDSGVIEKAEKIKEKIIETAFNWQSSGYAKKIKEAYLKGESTRYFSGKRLK